MLGIGIPYYKNSEECEIRFKKLMTTLYKQYPDRGYILVYERNPRIGTINSNYYYNYGANPNSLMMKYARSEIGLKKED